ncbi:diaminopimelate epimerase [Membranihabitans maritimus]|uniref:diaminopimelate epimerase n=1 Tax=Membranihabitans maritimus TaxID=2904244 RepID=UPI001F02205B|nr:diaminopimelate epimerase [Membranihabitans maritimus]
MNFTKYQGTGNDFVIINGNKEDFDRSDYAAVRAICDRKFGIGADGFIVVSDSEEADFEMLYYNADGKPGSMCGNGGRCAVTFAYSNGFFTSGECRFMAYDGMHEARIMPETSVVELKMSNVETFELGNRMTIMDTGSPHYVTLVEDIDDIDIVEAGKVIRYSPRFTEEGINVNFVENKSDFLEVATYERGVEDETLSCGTGVTASALSFHVLQNGRSAASGELEVKVHTKGGDLKVKFEYDGSVFSNIWLVGKGEKVFDGCIDLEKIENNNPA